MLVTDKNENEQLKNFMNQFQKDILLMSEKEKIWFCKLTLRTIKNKYENSLNPLVFISLVKINGRIKMFNYSDENQYMIGNITFNLNIHTKDFINKYTKTVQYSKEDHYVTFNDQAIPFILSHVDQMYSDYYQRLLKNEEFNAYQNMMNGNLFLKDDDKKRLLNAFKQGHYLPSNKQDINLSLFKDTMSDDLYDILKKEFNNIYLGLNESKLKEYKRVHFLIAYSYFFQDIQEYMKIIEPYKNSFNQKKYRKLKDDYLNPCFSYSLALE